MQSLTRNQWRTAFALLALCGALTTGLYTSADDAKPEKPAKKETKPEKKPDGKPADAKPANAKPAASKDDADKPEEPKEPKPLWTVSEGFDMPENAYYDFRSNTLFVSQVGGKPDKKDKHGFISKIDADGKVLALNWVEGLNAPKGMHTVKGKLWVSDLDELIGIDIASGKIVDRIPAEGAKFLNDVACDAEGTVYVSDTLASRIYQYKDKKMTVFAEGPELESPNGLLVHDDLLVVAAWGLTTDFKTEVPGRVYALHLATKTKELITPEPVGNLDGIDFDGSGGYLVSDWVTGEVLQITVEGKINTILKLTQGTADLSFDPARQMLFVPRMLDHKVCAYSLPVLTE